ncbi:MAG: RNA methyltransferase [Aquiluna sp.]
MSDLGSARIKEVARLHQKDARLETGLFLLEGPQGLKELVGSPELVVEIFSTSAAIERYALEFAELQAAGCAVVEVSEKTIARISDTRTPQGVVAILRQFDISLDDLVATHPRLVAVLDRIQDPGNAGTVLRAADAAGADGVVFSKQSVDLYNPKLVRSTAGSLLHIPAATEADTLSAIAELKAAGLQVLATSGSGELLTEIAGESLAMPTAWVFGNEASGVSQAVLEACDKTVAIPIYGSAESLNLSTAAAICLYTSAFAQRAHH